MRLSTGEKIFNCINLLFMTLVLAIFIIPVLYVIKQSLDVGSGAFASLIPKKISLVYYRMIFQDQGIYRPFLNSIFVTAAGTVLSLFLEAMGAYTLSRRNLPGNRLFTYMLIGTMLFSGGLVPSYLVVKELGMIDSMSALIIPACISAWNIILIRNFYFSIPESLYESAKMDGAEDFKIFMRIIIPLSKPILATIALYTGVAYWNTFFSAIMYINSPKKYTFPVKLYEMILVQEANMEKFDAAAGNSASLRASLTTEGISSAMIIVSFIPIVIVYPYLQKYFVKGIMIGSIKG